MAVFALSPFSSTWTAIGLAVLTARPRPEGITTTARTDEEAYELLRLLGMPFDPSGRPGEEDTAAAEEEERRLEEARMRAEAEQAALEQLKEENPEAYERKVREPEEGEEGEEGAEGEGAPEAEGESGGDDEGSED